MDRGAERNAVSLASVCSCIFDFRFVSRNWPFLDASVFYGCSNFVSFFLSSV